MASLVERCIHRTFLILGALAVLCALCAGSVARAAPFAGIVMDGRSGEVIWQENADTRLHPASLTKMMTLYITFQEIQAGRLSLDSVITVSKHAAAQPPSRLGLKPGQKIKLRYLIRAAAIKSANDAAAALGDAIGGNEAAFAKRMTRTARALGMKNTTFKNAHGLTAPGHLSTARDMTILGRHLFYDFPQFYGLFSRRTEDAGIAKVTNTNSRFLDSYEGADGIKTGYTVPAGYNLTASAARGDKRIIATIFGGKSTAHRNAKMKEMLDLGFRSAKDRVKTRTPQPAPVIPMEEPKLVASTPAAPPPQVAPAEVARAVTRSPRPKARPTLAAPSTPAAPAVDDEIAVAIAMGVQEALAEANAPPPPPGTLEAQAHALAEGRAPVEEGVTVASAEATAPASEPAPEVALAAATPTPGLRPMPRPESILARTAQAAPAPKEELPFQVVTSAEELPPAPVETVAGAEPVQEVVRTAAVEAEAPAPRPTPRPETIAPQAQEVRPAAPVAAPAPEPVVEMAATEVKPAPAEAAPTVARANTAPTRRAPIFDAVASSASAAEAQGEQIVVSKSTSDGSRQWAVNVGAFNSRYEAEKALLKTGLAESATLNEGLRKITEKGGKYRATFLGLNRDQADLACRRLRARGMICETSGPT